jgi:hypothetical protein
VPKPARIVDDERTVALELLFDAARQLGWDIAISGMSDGHCPGLVIGELGFVEAMSDNEPELEWTLSLSPVVQ